MVLYYICFNLEIFMTYHELGVIIAAMTEEQQKCDVTVYIQELDEYYPLVGDYPMCVTEEPDVLDDNHPYLIV